MRWHYSDTGQNTELILHIIVKLTYSTVFQYFSTLNLSNKRGGTAVQWTNTASPTHTLYKAYIWILKVAKVNTICHALI